jgi:transposase-like protein
VRCSGPPHPPSTLPFRYWRNHHEDIRRAVQRAEAEAAGLVREAAEDGDWRAAAHQLERLVDPDEQTLEVILRLVRTVLAGELEDWSPEF